jgi:hypothetical protein
VVVRVLAVVCGLLLRTGAFYRAKTVQF